MEPDASPSSTELLDEGRVQIIGSAQASVHDPVFPQKNGTFRSFRPQKGGGGTLRSRLAEATRAQAPESGTPGAALRESQPPASRPLAVGPLGQCLGAPVLSGANQRTGPKFGGGALWGGVEGGALPRSGRRAACRVCGKESGASRSQAEEAGGPGSEAGDAPAQLSGRSRLTSRPAR